MDFDGSKKSHTPCAVLNGLARRIHIVAGKPDVQPRQFIPKTVQSLRRASGVLGHGADLDGLGEDPRVSRLRSWRKRLAGGVHGRNWGHLSACVCVCVCVCLPVCLSASLSACLSECFCLLVCLSA